MSILMIRASADFIVAMKRMAVSNVLIVGLQGLGAEIGEIHQYISAIFIYQETFSQERCLGWCEIRHIIRSGTSDSPRPEHPGRLSAISSAI